jgi:hypothetical protein
MCYWAGDGYQSCHEKLGEELLFSQYDEKITIIAELITQNVES